MLLALLLLSTSLAAPDLGVAAAPAEVPTPAETAIAAGVPEALATDVASRAAARGVDAAAALQPVIAAVRAGVPPEAVAAKVLEGLAKGIPADRVFAVATSLGERLARAGALLDDARAAGLALDPDGRRAALADLGDALAAGVTPDAVRALVAAARGAGASGSASVVAAARALGDLARRGVSIPEALPLALALAGRPPLRPGEVAALYDAYRREGGESPTPFLEEARRRAASGEPLEGIVDHFGDSPDHVNRSGDAGAKRTSAPGNRARDGGAGRADPGSVPGLDGEPRGRALGKGRSR